MISIQFSLMPWQRMSRSRREHRLIQSMLHRLSVYLRYTSASPLVIIPATQSGLCMHEEMSFGLFQILCQDLGPHLNQCDEPALELRILATLWLLANKESFRGVADRFGVSKGSLHYYVMQVVEGLSALVTRYTGAGQIIRIS